MNSIRKTGTENNIFGDNVAFVEKWDFSQANLNEENRIRAITQVASICYQSPKALGSETLYNRLMAESMGLPSSSFEFVGVLLDNQKKEHVEVLASATSNARKYGEEINDRYFLTNYRALVYDYENSPGDYSFDIRKIFNSKDECDIIRKNYKVYLYKIDLPTRSQSVRHRIHWQELSRRYVSGKRVPFEFYVSDKMNKVKSEHGTTDEVIGACVDHYFAAIESGVKPEEARRIIPQAAYTQIWGGFLPTPLENFFKLRLDKHAQKEIRYTAEAMKRLNEKESE